MKYTVKQLAELAGVTRRTLHHYDDLGLLNALRDPENNYRFYTETELLRLQQIMFYRALGLDLREIARIIDQPEFSAIQALKSHRQALEKKHHALNQLIQTVDYTMSYLEGKEKMNEVKLFEGFDEKQQEIYAKEAAERWDPELVKQSQAKWKGSSKAEQEKIKAEGEAIYKEIAMLMERPVNDPLVQAQMHQWHQNLRFFYEPSIEILRGLGQMYVDDSRFKANFDKLDPGLANYLKEAIHVYCDDLDSL